MIREFKLRSNRKKHLATVLFFYKEKITPELNNLGIIFTADMSSRAHWVFKNETIEQIIADLAGKLNINYYDFVEKD